jgi:hypothetical protein
MRIVQGEWLPVRTGSMLYKTGEQLSKRTGVSAHVTRKEKASGDGRRGRKDLGVKHRAAVNLAESL